MKTVIKIALGIVAFAVIALACVWGNFYYSVHKGDPEGQSLANQWVPAIVSGWNYAALTEHFDADFTVKLVNSEDKTFEVYTGNNATEAGKLFEKAKNKLGNVVKIFNETKCDGPESEFICTTGIKFEGANAAVLIVMAKKGADHKIIEFTVISNGITK